VKDSKRLSLSLSLLILFYLISCIGAGLLFAGCGGVVTPEPPGPVQEDYVYLDVPYVHQARWNWCLPASGTMVFNYYGVNVTLQQVADKVINENTGGGSTKKLREYARELGFEAEFRNLNLEWVKKVLQQDVPIIIGQDLTLTNNIPHARVVIGYDDKTQELITHDPSLGKDYRMSYSEAIALNTIKPPFFRSNMIYPKDVNLNLP
jgi:uncharacterized protein YceK